MPTDPLEQVVERLESCLDGWTETHDRKGYFLHFAPPRVGPGSYQHIELATEAAAALLTSMAQELAEAKANADDLQQTFDLQWKADMRGVEMWRKDRPERALTLPDHGHLVSWLLEELDDLSAYRDVVYSAAAAQTYDDAAEKWLGIYGVDRMVKAVTSVFSKWANEDLMVRYREKVADIMHQAFVEGAMVGRQAAEAELASERAHRLVAEQNLREAIKECAGWQEAAQTAAGERDEALKFAECNDLSQLASACRTAHANWDLTLDRAEAAEAKLSEAVKGLEGLKVCLTEFVDAERRTAENSFCQYNRGKKVWNGKLWRAADRAGYAMVARARRAINGVASIRAPSSEGGEG